MTTTATDASVNEFQRAKSFWQTRATRSQSQTADSAELPVVPKRRSSNATVPPPVQHANGAAPTATAPTVTTTATTSFAKRIAPFAGTSTTPATSDFRASIVPAAAARIDSPSTPAPDHTMPPTPLPSIEPTHKCTAAAAVIVNRSTHSSSNASSNAPTTTATNNATAVVNNMFKSLSETKLFGAAKSKATRSLSFATLSTTWKQHMPTSNSNSNSNDSNTNALSPLAGTAAKLNIYNPSQRSNNTSNNNSKSSNAVASGTPYGELIVAEVLAARDLSVGDLIHGESDPFVVVQFDATSKSTRVAAATLCPVFNERFVFWVPSSPAIDQQHVRITVVNKNRVIADEHLGEVHLSLALPRNEAFDDWYPLVRLDGMKKGAVRIGVRRMVLTSPQLLLAAQSLAAHDRSLNDDDLHHHGATIPALWYGFAEAQADVASPTSTDDAAKLLLKQTTDLVASKLNHLSRRFIGMELTTSDNSSSSNARRDVF